MLNYKELTNKFNDLLSKTTVEEIDAWLSFDEEREKQKFKPGQKYEVSTFGFSEIIIKSKKDLQYKVAGLIFSI